MFSANNLRQLLIEKCLTVKALSLASGVSESSINKILNHGKKPNTATIGKIAKALNVPAAALLK